MWQLPYLLAVTDNELEIRSMDLHPIDSAWVMLKLCIIVCLLLCVYYMKVFFLLLGIKVVKSCVEMMIQKAVHTYSWLFAVMMNQILPGTAFSVDSIYYYYGQKCCSLYLRITYNFMTGSLLQWMWFIYILPLLF